MARDYIINDSTVDGEYISKPMTGSYWSMLLSSISFFSDSERQEQVTPTGGVVSVTLSPDGKTYYSIPAGEFSAAESYNPNRTMPNALGKALYCKITLNGVSGASYFTAQISRTV